MPGKACDNIADPVERRKCKEYKGKYSKMGPANPVKGRARKSVGGGGGSY
jgi:hypothetical protein